MTFRGSSERELGSPIVMPGEREQETAKTPPFHQVRPALARVR
jgi:hypothetical protein